MQDSVQSIDDSSLISFLERNGAIEKQLFEKIVYQCILDSVIFSVCEDLKKNDELLKQTRNRIKKIGGKAIANLFSDYSLTQKETDYAMSIVNHFIYKMEGRSSDISNYKPALLKKQNNKCACCGITIKESNCDVDHKIPHCYVGDSINSVDTLQVLCKDCNSMKNNKPWFPINYYLKHKKIPNYLLE